MWGNTFLPIQSTSSNHAWRVTRSFSLNPLTPLGISSRICCVPLPSGSLFSLGAGRLSLTKSCVRLRTDSYPATRRDSADLQKPLLLGTGVPIVLHRRASMLSPVDALSCFPRSQFSLLADVVSFEMAGIAETYLPNGISNNLR